MTLAELSSFVCSKTGRTDSDSVARCKEFLSRRYRLIWDSQLWRDSVLSVTQSVAIDEQDVTISDLSIDQVIGISWGDEPLEPSAYEQIFSINPSAFTDRGNVVGFVHLPKTPAGNARVKLVRKPSEASTITILGKSALRIIDGNNQFAYRDLELDPDKAALRGIDNALIAYAEGDMLTRERQYGKSQLMYAEGAAHVKVAIGVERSQAASNIQITPVYGGEWSRDDWDTTISYPVKGQL